MNNHKLLIFAFLLAHSPTTWIARGQTTNTFPASGSVGVGTLSPTYNLQVGSSSASYSQLAAYSSSSSFSPQRFSVTTGRAIALINNFSGATDRGVPHFDIRTWNQSEFHTSHHCQQWRRTNACRRQAGNVGIGTTDPTFPLCVNGTVLAKEVIVMTGWSDYVFNSGYRLAP